MQGYNLCLKKEIIISCWWHERKCLGEDSVWARLDTWKWGMKTLEINKTRGKTSCFPSLPLSLLPSFPLSFSPSFSTAPAPTIYQSLNTLCSFRIQFILMPRMSSLSLREQYIPRSISNATFQMLPSLERFWRCLKSIMKWSETGSLIWQQDRRWFEPGGREMHSW